jgi:hypothetical protein
MTIIPENAEVYYVEGHAATVLWDGYVKYKQEGQSGDDITLSPFANTVVSEYVIDELVTIPVDHNAFKKHVLMLSIFPTLPVTAAITKVTPQQLDVSDLSDLLLEPGFAGLVGSKRAAALVSAPDLADLEQDLKNKEAGRQAAERFLQKDAAGNIVYINPPERISIRDAIKRIVDERQLKPRESNYDFHLLCMHLYAATRSRLIDVATRFRKGPSQMLNHQIDFYHLSYLPFVKGFITDDTYLTMVAQELIDYLDLNKEVITGDEFHSRWLRRLLGGW